MLIREILTELTFAGSHCTKDCSGHKAGFRWAMRKGVAACNANNQSFKNGCTIAGAYQAKGLKVSPKVRDERGKFFRHPVIP
jgi:hypothetical protein